MTQQSVFQVITDGPNRPVVYDVGIVPFGCDFHPAARAVKALHVLTGRVYLCHACCEDLAGALLIVPDYTEAQWGQERESE